MKIVVVICQLTTYPLVIFIAVNVGRLAKCLLMKSDVYNSDCLTALYSMGDNEFDLAVCDPPYGIGAGEQSFGKWSSSRILQSGWDDKPPTADYFQELQRVSVNQIIFGGNYFSLPPTRGFAIWDKGNGFRGRDFAECEMIWTSFDRNAKVFSYDPLANGDYHNGQKIHKCQKPVALYKWLLMTYAEPGQSILDTHMGSGSSRIAAYDLGFDFVGYELDPDYFQAAEQRFERHRMQPKLFSTPVIVERQEALFA